MMNQKAVKVGVPAEAAGTVAAPAIYTSSMDCLVRVSARLKACFAGALVSFASSFTVYCRPLVHSFISMFATLL